MGLPIALFGGTFDPIHLGHLRVAWEAMELLGAEVRLIPSGQPPHRTHPVASVTHRVDMLRLALGGQDRLVLDEREVRRLGPSYTIDTLLDFRHEFGQSQSLILLVGADAFAGLPSWKYWRELFDLAHVGVLARSGYSGLWPSDLASEATMRITTEVMKLHHSPAGYVYHLHVSALDISASTIRALLKSGRSPRYLMPDALLTDPTLLKPYQ